MDCRTVILPPNMRNISKRFRKTNSLFLYCLLIILLSGCASTRRGILVSGLPPQINSESCQSNFLAQALSRQFPSEYPIGKTGDFQDLEKRIRTEIETVAEGTPVTHRHWQIAVQNVSAGKYMLVEHGFADLEDALVKIRSTTENGRNAAGISVTRIEGETYPDGHVVTVLAADEDGEMTIFNSWVKEDGVAQNEARILRTKDIEIKKFGTKYLVYEVVPRRRG